MCWSSTKPTRAWTPHKTDLAFDRIRRKFTLHLSGTPSRRWRTTSLPGMPSSTAPTPTSRPPSGTGRAHRGSRIPTPTSPCSTSIPTRCPRSSGTIQKGVEIDGETQEFAFDLNEFFQGEAQRQL
ncbi:MAG: hypothetical protein ACLVJH_02275 [Faecalibacterium prausnitzii]